MEDFNSESLEDLEAKVEEYRSSLDTVDAALENDSAEPQLLRLRNDLLEVIGLTEDLVNFRRSQTAASASTEHAAAAPADESSRRRKRNFAERDERTEVAGEGPAASSSCSISQNLIGRTCLAAVGNRKCFGEIIRIKKPPATDNASDATIVVEFFGTAWGGERGPPPSKTEFSAEQVQVLPLQKHLGVGAKCQAIASEDGQLRPCVIDARLSSPTAGGVIGYKVKFTDLETTEDLKCDRVYMPPKVDAGAKNGASAKKGSQQKKAAKEIVTPAGYRIPEYLQAKPTDSQHQIKAKKRKINMLKKEQKKEHVEEEAKQRQSSWLSHNRKVSGRKVGSSRESIFSTSENPEAKVGVTNSGRGMTSFDRRQRHDYDDCEGD